MNSMYGGYSGLNVSCWIQWTQCIKMDKWTQCIMVDTVDAMYGGYSGLNVSSWIWGLNVSC